MSSAPTHADSPNSIRVLSLFDLDPRKYGSMEEYAVVLSTALRARGWKSILVFSGLPPDHVANRLEKAGAQFEAYAHETRFGAYFSIFKILRRWRAEVLHVHFLEYFSVLPILAWLSGAKRVIYTDHYRQPQPIGLRTRLACWLWDRILFSLTGTRIVAVSHHIKKTLVEWYKVAPERIHIIPNGVNPGRFVSVKPVEQVELRKTVQLPTDGRVVVCASNLRPEKGIDDLLRAATIVLGRWPKACFVILGEGPESGRLRELARTLGIDEHVRFTGLRSDVDLFMAASDVVVTPSVWQEPAGLVVIEGMAAGRPVVATRVGGIPEYLQDGVAGILVEPREPSALAQAILSLLEDPERAAEMGKAGRKRVEEVFSMERWITNTLALYDDMTAGR